MGIKKADKQYEGYYADCYVLAPERSAKYVYEFLNHFVEERKCNQDEFPIPDWDNPEQDLGTEVATLSYLEKNGDLPYTLYWDNKVDSELKGAMCFFTNDGELVLGLSTETYGTEDDSIEREWFEKLKHFSKSVIGYITYENPAPRDSKEFKKRVNL